MARSVVGNFELNCALTDRRTLKITGVVYSDDSAIEVSKRVDAMQDEVDRQVIRVDIVSKAAQLKSMEENIERQREAVDGLIKKRDGGKINSQEKKALENADRGMEQNVKMMESLASAIAEGKKKLQTA